MAAHAEVVRDLNELAIKSHLMSQLAMVAVYLLDDPNYTKEDGARDVIRIINDLDSLAACISLDDEITQDEVAAGDEIEKDHSDNFGR